MYTCFDCMLRARRALRRVPMIKIELVQPECSFNYDLLYLFGAVLFSHFISILENN
jgi:hypothetical protein